MPYSYHVYIIFEPRYVTTYAFEVFVGTQKHSITKTCLYNIDPPPLNPTFYIVKLGLQGYTLFFLILLKNVDCGYSLEPPHRGGSNEYLQSMFWAEIWKIVEFLIWNFQFLEVKFSIYLIRRVFIMTSLLSTHNILYRGEIRKKNVLIPSHLKLFKVWYFHHVILKKKVRTYLCSKKLLEGTDSLNIGWSILLYYQSR